MSRPGAQKKQRPANKLSQYLYDEENVAFVDMLGSNSYSLAAGIAQLLAANHARHQWEKIDVGVVGFVKDYSSKAYLIRLFDLNRKTVVFEQKLYTDFRVRSPNNVDRLVTFEGDKCVYGLNFAFPDEAKSFKASLDKCYEQQLKQKRRGSASMADEGYHEGSTMSSGSSRGTAYGSSTGSSQVYAGKQTQISSNNIVIPTSNPVAGDLFTTNSGASAASRKGSYGGTLRKLHKDGKRKNIKKSEISLPTNFEHRVHVGWDPATGVQSMINEEDLDPNIKQLLEMIGMRPTELKQEDRKFIYEFVDHHGGMDQLKKELTQQHHHPPPPVPPPPPSRQPISHRQHAAAPAPPPPPPRDPVATGRPLPPTPRSAPVAVPTPPPPAPGGLASRPSDTPPPPPPPISSLPRPGGGAAPPPPPPPPPTVGAPPPPPPPPPPFGGSTVPPPPPMMGSSAPPLPASGGRSDLMKQIQEGRSLRHVEQTEAPPAAAGRDKLMDSIRMGVTLRETPKDAKQERVTPPEDMGGIAGALARALAERRPQIESDESETDSDDDEDPDDDEWGD